ncbi:MAG: leucine--tRNA ligase [Oligoflexales bacterium]
MVQEDINQYDFCKIEKKWQQYWVEQETFATQDFGDKPKFYVLDMFPYPSGNGLHVGHVEGYTATDIVARHKRMQGFNVLHPMGWDAFGLPAEQYAIKTNTHPRETTVSNISNFKRQIQSLGFSTDWKREVDTTDPKYYKWTQWIFSKLFEKGLAYESFAPVNWCPALGTVLANEEVIDGRSEVGDHPVEKKPIRQWVLKITEYAERLLTDLEDLDWPESTKEMQKNWIGKSTGANVSFSIDGHSGKGFEVFTTRPDTLFGATFCVLAPEHPLVSEISSPDRQADVDAYCQEAKNKSDMDRTSLTKDKSGVNTGAFAINPVNQKKIPIFCADYVLMSYGSGAIMAVPGHDERDHEFAKKYGIEIIRVLTGGEEDIEDAAHPGDGELVNSEFLNGLSKAAAIEKMCSWLEEEGFGKKAITYRLRDWIFSRQRYWGEPFPIAHDKEGNTVLIPESELPITLPVVSDYKPSGSGEPPLSKAEDWLAWSHNGKEYTRETNIMPQWAGSCWYYLRYLDPDNTQAAWDPEKEKHWLPVDLYVGGVEHANLHLLYARFWHKVLYDLGYVSTKEPFKKLRHPGLVLGPNGEKMSKSRGNVVNPDDVIKDWGTDSLRLYEMFMGPLDQVKPWQTAGITGVHRFLKRIWKLAVSEDGQLSEKISAQENSPEFSKILHKTIKKVSEDCEEMKFNTAISAMMELLNACSKEAFVSKKSLETLTLLLAPFAPHISEELWLKLGHQESIAFAAWPQFDPELVKDDTVTVSIMLNGKFRTTIDLNKACTAEDAIKIAKAQATVARFLEGKSIKKEIYVPGKIVNFVVAKG